MKQLALAILLLYFSQDITAQYYLRGEVRDEKNNILQNVRILLCSKGTYPFTSGNSGSFGIPTSRAIDTITLLLDGYETLRTAVETNKFQRLVMKMLPATASLYKHRLASFTKNLINQDQHYNFSTNESYNNQVENEFIETSTFSETGFALNIDRASYSNIRRFLNMGYRVPPDAVRIEEMLNYFDFGNNTNTSTNSFTCTTEVTSTPWNRENQLLFVHLQAPKLNLEQLPPTNLIFLIDVSGSMDKPNRLPLVKSGLKLLVQNLRDKDSVAIVIYGGDVGVLLQPTSGGDKNKINSAIENMVASGSTPGEAAIRMTYKLAAKAFNKNGNNRVILATDGDFNVGQTTEKELEDLIVQQRQSGIFLTCLGVGMGNYKDSKLETLAKKGNGNFAYLDNLQEAEKVLVKEFTKTMYAVANDAFLSIQFNPTFVKEYRLIGFDNKSDALNDSSSELEGGEVGTGHDLTAVFEIKPNEKVSNTVADSIITIGKYAMMKLQYKLPAASEYTTQTIKVPFNYGRIEAAQPDLRFTTAVIMFGELLKQSKFAQGYTFTDVWNLAAAAADKTDYAQTEFLTLVEKARKIYSGDKKKKKGSEE